MSIRYPSIKYWITALLLTGCISDARSDLRFLCQSQLAEIQRGLPDFFHRLNISTALIIQSADEKPGLLTLSLATVQDDILTLDFFLRPEYFLSTEPVDLPVGNGLFRTEQTVSRKEIVLALLQHGRVTEFKGKACSLAALIDHVGIRQNIVAWTERLNWIWPNGGSAKWNPRYWRRGTPRRGVSLHTAVMDTFIHQEKYSIGCYTATKLVFVQGMLDYYRRIKKDPIRLLQVEKALLADGDPLADIEPGEMWSFETDFPPQKLKQPGKLLSLHFKVAQGNFVPGDWGYFLNTDAASYKKVGYEGSNFIYLGRNLFDDYYNDHDHRYTYEQKIDEVYQWRHGVFSRLRDLHKVKPLSNNDFPRLGKTPNAGGIQLDVRLAPRYF